MDDIRLFIAQVFALGAAFIIRIFKLGTGATWPGEIALRIYPSILKKLQKNIHRGIILVAGTNGKTTTSLMIRTVLEREHFSVLHNASGANLQNGIVSTLLLHPIPYDFAVFEVDENTLARVLSNIQSQKKVIVVLLNLFRDQLDRYGEVDAIAEHWRSSLKQLSSSTHIVANADDPTIAAITKNVTASVSYFGIENEAMYLPRMQHATDAIYCPFCGKRLTFGGTYFSHLGKWTCGSCGFNHPDVHIQSLSYTSPLEGVYNIYNTLAAASALESFSFDPKVIQTGLNTFTPAFGRMETKMYKGKHVQIVLSKNPTGFNESLRTVVNSKKHGPVLLLLNDRIPDGTDVSWIWDVDFEQLDLYGYPIIVSGDRGLDMAVRMKYAMTNDKWHMTNKRTTKAKTKAHERQQDSFEYIETLEKAIERGVAETKEGEQLWILATYSAMLDARKIITGKKIL